MSIPKDYRTNLSTIIRAAKNGALCVREYTDKATGKVVIALCAAGQEGTEIVMSPLAKMFDANPYDELLPPQ